MRLGDDAENAGDAVPAKSARRATILYKSAGCDGGKCDGEDGGKMFGSGGGGRWGISGADENTLACMEVRLASLDDCRAIAEVHVASWQAAYAGILDPLFLAGLSVERREESWREVLAAGQSELLIASEGADTVGLASLGRSRDTDALPGRGELMALYVHPRSWSTGAGRELWSAARDRLKSIGFSSVSLWVLKGNTRAISFYSAAGFAVDSGVEREFELGGTMVREVRMVHAS